MTFKSLLAIALLLTVAGCSGEDNLQQPHEVEDLTSRAPYFSARDEECPSRLILIDFSVDLCEVEKKKFKNNEFDSLKNFLFSPGFQKNQDLYHHDKVKSLVRIFNRGLLTGKKDSVVKDYIKVMISDCDSSDLKKCKKYLIFSAVSNTHDVLRYYLEKGFGQERINDIYVLATSSANKVSKGDLLKVLAFRMDDIPKNDPRIAQLIAVGRTYSPGLTPFELRTLNSYLTDRDQAVIKSGMSVSDIKKIISDSYARLRSSLLAGKIDEIRKDRPELITGLRLKDVDVDVSTKLIDLIFSRHLQVERGFKVFKKLGLEGRLLSKYKSYNQWLTAYQILKMDRLAQQQISQLPSTGKDFFLSAVDALEPVRTAWGAYTEDIGYLTKQISDKATSQILKSSLFESVSGLSKTIKIYSEYPHSFYISHFVSQSNFTRDFNRVSWRATVNSRTIFSDFLLSKSFQVSPLSYTQVNKRLSPLLIKKSLIYSLNSGFLEEVKIDPALFVKRLMKDLSNKFVARPKQVIKNVKSFLKGSKENAEVIGQCRRLKSGLKMNLNLNFDEMREGLLLKSFYHMAFSHTLATSDAWIPGALKSGSRADSGLMPYSLDIRDLIEYMHVDLDVVLRLFNLIKSNISKDVAQAAEFDFVYGKILSAQKEAAAAFSSWRESGECMSLMLAEERKLLDFILKKEKEYLEESYSNINILRQGTNADHISQIIAKYQQGYRMDSQLLGAGFKSLDDISPEGLGYSQFNLFGRIATYLKEYEGPIHFKVRVPVGKSEYYKLGRNQEKAYNYLSYTERAEDFFREGLKMAFSDAPNDNRYVTWFVNYSEMLKSMRYYTAHELALLRTPVGLSVSKFMKVHDGFIKFHEIADAERLGLSASNTQYIFKPLDMFRTFVYFNRVKNSYEGPRGLFDWVLLRLQQDVLGSDYETNLELAEDITASAQEKETARASLKHRRGPYTQAEDYYNTMTDLENKLIYYESAPEFVDSEKKRLSVVVKQKEDLISEFLKHVKEKDTSSLRVDIRLDESIRGVKFGPKAVDDYVYKKSQFHRKTNQCFSGTKDCKFTSD